MWRWSQQSLEKEEGRIGGLKRAGRDGGRGKQRAVETAIGGRDKEREGRQRRVVSGEARMNQVRSDESETGQEEDKGYD